MRIVWNNFRAFEGEDWLPNNPKRRLNNDPVNRVRRLLPPSQLGKGFALDIPSGYGSQESEARMAFV